MKQNFKERINILIERENQKQKLKSKLESKLLHMVKEKLNSIENYNNSHLNWITLTDKKQVQFQNALDFNEKCNKKIENGITHFDSKYEQ